MHHRAILEPIWRTLVSKSTTQMNRLTLLPILACLVLLAGVDAAAPTT